MKTTGSRTSTSPALRFRNYGIILSVIWTLVIAGSLVWNHLQIRDEALLIAKMQARAFFEKDLLYRRWASRHGGVYVPVTKDTPPNPYLSHIPNRDIVTRDGRELTLMNPAYMTRQVFEMAQEYRGTGRGHITSIRPLRPENTPDPWETSALMQFQKGAVEVEQVDVLEGKPYFRYMSRLIAEPPCLKCHAQQGYREGEVRGGLSVSVPMEPITTILNKQMVGIYRNTVIIWLLGLGVILFSFRKLQQATATVEEEERKYRALFQQAAVGVAHMDTASHRYREVNSRYCEIVGYPAEELHDLTPADITWPEDRASSEALHQALVDGTIKDYSVQKRYIHKEGHPVWTTVTVRSMQLPGGQPQTHIAVLEDISESKRAEEMLQEYRKVIECSSDFVWLLDREHRFLLANRSFLEKRQLTADLVLGRTLGEVIGREEFEEIRQYVDQGLAGKPVSFELQHKGDHNRPVYLAGVFTPLDDTSGSRRLACIIRDITDHRNLEEQLRHAQKMEAIGQLAGGVAHDFNNILTVIIGYSNLLKMDKTLGSLQQERLDQIITASDRASQLTNGLLAFSRKQAVALQAVNLNEIVQQVRKFVERIIGEDVKLRTVINTPLLLINADNSQIEQVLVNLATNARDAMPRGGQLSIQTDLQTIDESFVTAHGYGRTGMFACLTVSDTGSGMSEEVRKRIFEPFFTTKEVGKGTGLGMAIVYGIVKQHNGFINAYSEPGEGTTFRIYLPIIEADSNRSAEVVPIAAPAGGSETILVAEDDTAVAVLVETVLTNYGYTVIIAHDGQECIDLFKKTPDGIHMILMDMIMPKKSGQEAFEEIRALRPDVKVLYSSGYTADFMHHRGALDEGVDMIMKPVQPMEMLRKVREVLDSGRKDGNAGS